MVRVFSVVQAQSKTNAIPSNVETRLILLDSAGLTKNKRGRSFVPQLTSSTLFPENEEIGDLKRG